MASDPPVEPTTETSAVGVRPIAPMASPAGPREVPPTLFA